jgi:hypothetical protein
MLIMMIAIYYSWMIHEKRNELPCCAKIGIVMPLLIFKIQCTIEGELSILMDCQCFMSKIKSYLCCHQSPKRRRLKVHLGP